MSSTTITQGRSPVRSTQTLLGLMNSIELITANATPIYDTNQTLNAHYNVFANQKPKSHPQLNYFGIGIGGSAYSGVGNIMRPQEVAATNANLYNPIPFRCVPVEQDLTDDERKQYAMRQVITKDGTNEQYVCYWLKRVVWNDTTVQFSRFDSSVNQNKPYTLDDSNLAPKPPAIPVDGSTPDISDEISVLRTCTLPITGAEVFEAINVLYNGDLNRASITEIGLFTGSDETVTVTDFKNNSLNYQEAILAQMFLHETTSVGIGFESADDLQTQTYRISAANMAVAQNNGSRI